MLLEQIALRLWPSASSTQGMNTALFDVIEKHKVDPDKVKKLRDMSPLYEMAKEGIDLSKIEWAAH